MGLKIITLIKQVPDTANITGDAMKPDGTINRAALAAITNPEDLNALEEALVIKEKLNAHITAITLGPPAALKVLKESLYRGVDDAVLVTDAKFAASDTLATSYALSKAIEKVGDYDLIICGRQAIDGDTAQVGPQIAFKLGLNQITGVVAVQSIDEKAVTVKRIIDGGYEILKANFPVLLTVVGEANDPRPPSAKRVMRYKNITCAQKSYEHPEGDLALDHIKQWSAEDLNADLKLCGLSGSPTKVKNIENVVLKVNDMKMVANGEAEIGGLMRELVTEHIIG